MPPRDCMCFSGERYATCCARLHRSEAAPTPVALMRSRYCAYVLRKVDYLMATTLPGGRAFVPNKGAWRRQIETFCRTTSFDGLEVVCERVAEQEAWVTFVARLRQGGVDASFCEKSRFCWVGGAWFYEGGEPRPQP